MKISSFLAAAVVAAVCLLEPTSAEGQVHLRVHVNEEGNDICYKACNSGQYCPRGEKQCRPPKNGECFNPATSLFIRKCDRGFKCSNGKAFK
ncbi:hypothetical protein PHYBOEH_004154 [Phytophthora boehmeriae]|uniref:Uncharacterized protein n=1 Tax=Phytophthora boehmeriae TaxID=109152 RepID=A0A8T1WTH6_9STRA|nr:hypothetical protein PHYBOEH_004154 [Phytophthora boehmeriae]